MMHIYTDGACSQAGKSSGPGGWGLVVVNENDESVFEASEGSPSTTNNIMEMVAFSNALYLIGQDILDDKNSGPYYIYSDSAYIINCLNDKWYIKWRNNGWKNSKKEPVKNKELWIEILTLYEYIMTRGHSLNIVKVKGHSNVKWNNVADELAVNARLKEQNK